MNLGRLRYGRPFLRDRWVDLDPTALIRYPNDSARVLGDEHALVFGASFGSSRMLGGEEKKKNESTGADLKIKGVANMWCRWMGVFRHEAFHGFPSLRR